MRKSEKGDKIIGNWYQTKNYTKFHYGINRDVKPVAVNRIARNMRAHGWQGAPIIVTRDFEIIDGQHRFEAAMKVGIDIYYIFGKKLTTEELADMNNAQQKWKDYDYAIAFSKEGNENYLNYLNLLKNYTSKESKRLVPTNVVLYAVTHDIYNSNSKTKIRNGGLELTFEDYEVAIDKLDYVERCYGILAEVKSTTKQSFGRNDYFGMAVLFMVENGVDRELLYKAISRRALDYYPAMTVEKALEQLENIYNYRKGGAGRIYIMSEYQRYKDERGKAKCIRTNKQEGTGIK